MVDEMRDEPTLQAIVGSAEKEFLKTNKQRIKKNLIPIPDEDLRALGGVLEIKPHYVGILDAIDNWLIETRKDSARARKGSG